MLRNFKLEKSTTQNDEKITDACGLFKNSLQYKGNSTLRKFIHARVFYVNLSKKGNLLTWQLNYCPLLRIMPCIKPFIAVLCISAAMSLLPCT